MWVTFFADDLLTKIRVTHLAHHPLIKAYPPLTDRGRIQTILARTLHEIFSAIG